MTTHKTDGPHEPRPNRDEPQRDESQSEERAPETPEQATARRAARAARDLRDGRPPRGKRKSRNRRMDPPPVGPTATAEVLAKLHATIEDGEFIVFDIETTGGNPERNGITEIFALRWSKDGVKDTFYSMVNPGVSIPPIVRRMTGITNAMVRTAPRIDDVMPKFLEFAKSDILVSHNTIGDMKFLRYFAQEACGVSFANFFMCTHLLVEKLAPETPDKSLKGLAEYFKLSTGDLHRAEADAYVTLDLFKVLLGKLGARNVKSIDEAVRLQGDLESGMRLGWGVDSEKLENIPPGPGVFYLYDHDGRLLFASSATTLDREVAKIRALSQLPRQLLRLVLKSYDLKVQRSPSTYAAMLEECEVWGKHKVTFDPQQWHQRSVTTLFIAQTKDGAVMDVGSFVEGVTHAYGPVRDRKHAGDLVAKIGAALGLGPSRAGLKLGTEQAAIVLAFLEGRLDVERFELAKRRRSFKLWFKPSERKDLTRRLDAMEKLLAITAKPKMEPLLEKTGVLVTTTGEKGSFHLHRIVNGLPTGVVPFRGDPDSIRVQGSPLAAQMVRELAADHAAQKRGPLSAVDAAKANATFWSIYYGRADCRFVPASDIGGRSLSAPPESMPPSELPAPVS